MRRFNGPQLVVRTEGDVEASRLLLPKARKLVGYLFDQMSLAGQSFMFQKWRFADGSRIQAFVRRGPLGDSALVRLSMPAGVGALPAMQLMIGFYHLKDGADPYLYETAYLLARLPKMAGAVDGDRKFKAPITIDTACYWKPDEYSGLMRLWVQAKRAANIAVPGLSWHRDTGLVRSPSGVYWFIFRNRAAGTLTAKRGQIAAQYGDSLDLYRVRAMDTGLAPFQRQVAESYYMAGLDVAPGDPGTVLLTDTRLVNGSDPLTPAMGTQWLAWTFQRRGQPDEHAPKLRWLHNETSGWHPFPRYGQPNPVNMLTCRVSFSFPAEDQIQASLTQEA